MKMNKEMVVRSAKLFKARFGRVLTDTETDTSCLPQSQSQADWLVGLSEADFDIMLSIWKERGMTVGAYREMHEAMEKSIAKVKGILDANPELRNCYRCGLPDLDGCKCLCEGSCGKPKDDCTCACEECDGAPTYGFPLCDECEDSATKETE
jgi:hypothetical protein